MRPHASSTYVAAATVTILLGLGIRRFLPMEIAKDPGDVLYATMVYWLIRACRPAGRVVAAAIGATAFCFGIEFLKLWEVPWLIAARKSSAGHLVFGSVFSVSNLVCYVIGIVIGWMIDRYLQAPRWERPPS